MVQLDCNNCGGSGVEVSKRLGPLYNNFRPCNIVMEREKYLIKMFRKNSKKVTLPIKKECNGEQILLKGLVILILIMKNDDLIFVINEQEHEIFKRKK